jgi:hypothetical protein
MLLERYVKLPAEMLSRGNDLRRQLYISKRFT